MSWEQVGAGSLLDVDDLAGYEDTFIGEGQRGMLEVDLRMSVSSSLVKQLENELRQRGVAEVSVTTASPMLRITYRKGFPWLPVIVAAILGLIVLAILIVGWRFFREIIETIPKALKPGLGIAVVAAIILGLVVLAKRESKK